MNSIHACVNWTNFHNVCLSRKNANEYEIVYYYYCIWHEKKITELRLLTGILNFESEFPAKKIYSNFLNFRPSLDKIIENFERFHE